MGAAEQDSTESEGVWVVSAILTAQPRVRWNLVFRDYGEAEHWLRFLRHGYPHAPRVRFLNLHWRG
jgi:hypothetical protein